jgi:hypothetical protein
MISIVSEPSQIVFSRGDVWIEIFSGASLGVPYTVATKPTNYRVEVRIEFEQIYMSGTFTEVVVLDEYPDNQGDITINIRDIIHSEFMRSFTEPPLPTIDDLSSYITPNTRRYKASAREVMGIDFTPGPWVDIGLDLNVIFGGITIDKSLDGYDPSSLDQEESIFTWMPSGMMVGVDQPFYLSVFGGGSVTLTLIDKNNTTVATKTIADPGTGSAQCATYHIGPKNFTDIQVDQGYKVVIETQSLVTRSYYIDHYRSGKMDVLFVNGFGAPECVRLYGEMDESMSVDREKMSVIRKSDTDSSIGDVLQYNSSWDDEFKLRTGFISEGEARALKDMLAYNMLWRIRGRKYEALDIVSDDIHITTTNQFLKVIEFEAVRAVKKKIIPIL